MNESWKDNQNIIHEEARGSQPGLNIFSFSILRLLLYKDTQLYLRLFRSLKKTFVWVWLFFFLNSRNNSVLGKCPISKKKKKCVDHTEFNMSDYKRDDPLGTPPSQASFRNMRQIKRTVE